MKHLWLVAAIAVFPLMVSAQTQAPAGKDAPAAAPDCSKHVSTGSHLPRSDCSLAQQRKQQRSGSSGVSFSGTTGGSLKSPVRQRIP